MLFIFNGYRKFFIVVLIIMVSFGGELGVGLMVKWIKYSRWVIENVMGSWLNVLCFKFWVFMIVFEFFFLFRYGIEV